MTTSARTGDVDLPPPVSPAGTVPNLMGGPDPTDPRRREARYDVVIVSDFTAGGHLGGDLAAEIRAQSSAGYTTALMPAEIRAGAGFDQRIATCVRRGLADLLLPGTSVSTRLLLLRLPPDLERLPGRHVTASAERVVVVFDTSHATDLALVAAVDEEIRRRVGTRPEWIGTSEAAGAAMRRVAGDRSPVPWAWGPVVELAAAARPVPRDRRPAVAWYRPGATASAGSLRDLVSPARRRLGRSWPVLDLDRSAPVLVSDLDVVVAPEPPDPAGPPDRLLLEALAAGAVVVLPPRARATFGDACTYADPSAVVGAVRRLTGDPDEWARRSQAAIAYVADGHGLQRHVGRLQELVGAPSGAPVVLEVARARARRRRVMFVSSNGAGVGHLTRLLAIARRLPGDVEPVFFTMSQAVSVVRRMGYPCEYLASAGYTGMEAGTWNRHLRARLMELLAAYGPEAVVFDGTYPYRGLLDVARSHPHVRFVWSRRPMWKEGAGKRSVIEGASRRFHMVIEPGELAEEIDRGLTVQYRHEAERVAPVTLLDRSEVLSRTDARAELGLDPDRPAVLVQLGAGNIDDAASVGAVVHERLRSVGGLQICATSHPIARAAGAASDLHVVSVYPLSRYLAAFDFGITAPGYNSFHEFVTFGVPAIFIANTQTSLDDQAARGRWAEQVGAGLSLESFTPEGFATALGQMLDPERREAMRRRCEAYAQENGASAAAKLLDGLLPAGAAAPAAGRLERLATTQPMEASRLDTYVSALRARLRTNNLLRRVTGRRPLPPAEARSAVVSASGALPVLSGRPLVDAGAKSQPVALVLCVGSGRDEIARLVAGIAELQAERQSFRPVFVVDNDDFVAFRQNDYLFEYLVPRDEWEVLTGANDWPLYVERRLQQITAAFRPTVVVDLSPVDGVERVEGRAALLGALAGVAPA